MSTHGIRRFEDLPVSPWANGLGETRELGADRTVEGPLLWRLSIATIAAASDFSVLPEVDRQLMNLGAGSLALTVGGEPVTVPRHEVVSFRGEDAVRATHANGYDLNVMTGRGRASGSLQAVTVARSDTFAGAPSTVLAVVALQGAPVVTVDGDVAPLAPLDCVIGTPGSSAEISGACTVALVRIALGS